MKTIIGKIVNISEINDDLIIIYGLYEGRKGLVLSEDIIMQIRGLKEKDFKEGNEIKIIEKKDKVYIIIEKSTP